MDFAHTAPQTCADKIHMYIKTKKKFIWREWDRVSLELTLQTKPPSNLKISACLCLPGADIRGVCHHPLVVFLFFGLFVFYNLRRLPEVPLWRWELGSWRPGPIMRQLSWRTCGLVGTWNPKTLSMCILVFLWLRSYLTALLGVACSNHSYSVWTETVQNT